MFTNSINEQVIYRREARRFTEGNINGIGWGKCWYILNALKRNRERECNKKRFSYLWSELWTDTNCHACRSKIRPVSYKWGRHFEKAKLSVEGGLQKSLQNQFEAYCFGLWSNTSYHKTPYFSRDIDPLQFRKTENGNLNQWKWKKMKTFKKKSSKTSLNTRN